MIRAGDLNGDGYIDFGEFKSEAEKMFLLQDPGTHPKTTGDGHNRHLKAHVSRVFRAVVTASKKLPAGVKLSRKEMAVHFEKIFAEQKVQGTISDDQLRDVFDFFDIDMSAKIASWEMQQTLENLGEQAGLHHFVVCLLLEPLEGLRKT